MKTWKPVSDEADYITLADGGVEVYDNGDMLTFWCDGDEGMTVLMPPNVRLCELVEDVPVELCSAHLWAMVDEFTAMEPLIDEDGNECDSVTPNFVVQAMMRDLRALVARYQPKEEQVSA